VTGRRSVLAARILAELEEMAVLVKRAEIGWAKARESYEEVALQIWKSIADRLIGQVKPKAYQEAAGYLRQMRKVYEQSGRLADWKALLTSLCVEHKAKRRLMEVLETRSL